MRSPRQSSARQPVMRQLFSVLLVGFGACGQEYRATENRIRLMSVKRGVVLRVGRRPSPSSKRDGSECQRPLGSTRGFCGFSRVTTRGRGPRGPLWTPGLRLSDRSVGAPRPHPSRKAGHPLVATPRRSGDARGLTCRHRRGPRAGQEKGRADDGNVSHQPHTKAHDARPPWRATMFHEPACTVGAG